MLLLFPKLLSSFLLIFLLFMCYSNVQSYGQHAAFLDSVDETNAKIHWS